MKANCWYGKHDVRVEEVPDPTILNPRDAIVRVTATAICGSDLHLYDDVIPTMRKGDILGHEFMGEVVELGSEVKNLRIGDRVVVPFPIACGHCFFCEKELYSLCENSNPNAWMAEKMWGHSPCGIFGYSHLTGGYAGGQAEYARVPFADVGPLKVPEGMTDEQVLFLDKFPFGSVMNRSLTIRTGQTHVHRYMRPLLDMILEGRIDPTYIITHRMTLDEAPEAYETFKHKHDDCVKVVLTP